MDMRWLRGRWMDEPGERLARSVVERLLTGQDLGDLPLSEHESRIDLRGLPASAPRLLDYFVAEGGWFVERLGGMLEFRDCSLRGLDLSGASLEHVRFFRSDVLDCRFDRARCGDWRLWASRVRRCSFAAADLRQSAMGTSYEGRGNEWEEVDFSESDLRHAHASDAAFEDCDFSRAKMGQFVFDGCTLAATRFAGILSDVRFDGRPSQSRPKAAFMRNVDLSDAVLSNVEFIGWTSLSDVQLPNDPDVFLVRHFRCVAQRCIDLLREDASLEARQVKGVFEGVLRAMRTEDEETIFNRRDWLDSGGEPLLTLAESTVRRALHECAGRSSADGEPG